MLFDLRSRGRRRTVQVIYSFLALVMFSGLILVGVGTGSGGGILNAFTNNGSGNNQGQVVTAQEKAALKATQKAPTSPSAWDKLVQARYETAVQQYSSTARQFTKAGRKTLNDTIAAWTRYLQLTKAPNTNTAILVAKAYAALGNYAGMAGAWQLYANANPTVPLGFECLAVSAYAAKESRVGDLAAAKAITLVPQAKQFELKQQLNAAKTSPASALAGC
jgi:hypothetical protein